MSESRRPGLWIAVVLLAGILVLGMGYASGRRLWFYGGLLITLAGVLAGVQKIVLSSGSGPE